jgi:hypothetical protein
MHSWEPIGGAETPLNQTCSRAGCVQGGDEAQRGTWCEAWSVLRAVQRDLERAVCELQDRRNEKETCGAALTADADTIET